MNLLHGHHLILRSKALTNFAIQPDLPPPLRVRLLAALVLMVVLVPFVVNKRFAARLRRFQFVLVGIAPALHQAQVTWLAGPREAGA